MEPETEDLNEQPKRSSKDLTQFNITHFLTDIVLIVVAIATPLYVWYYNPFGGDSHWFSRSGVVMVICGILLESRLFLSKLVMYRLSQAEQKEINMTRLITRKIIALISHLILIAGAIITGWGDLIFAEIKLS